LSRFRVSEFFFFFFFLEVEEEEEEVVVLLRLIGPVWDSAVAVHEIVVVE
jgi:hypothetical protein